ncbi:hypothetical protein B0H17DRAFT_1102808 [Mycena rosella]|uniref:Uncharacterized protein n=1 Tax=Mycena rosella TaxID=1033263 RepID=A0AAD7CHB1_MYCRO|nr:hypothetical protein B0H17DRAFT_1102808 [Mycena rosella]
MGSRATDNLRSYYRKATLPEMLRDPVAPEMPPTGQRSHHVNMQVAPQPWRQLCEIRALETWGLSLGELATSWADDQLPSKSMGIEDLDSDTGEGFTVPAGPTFNIPPHSGRRPTDIMRMIPWLDYLPLMTVQGTLRLLFPTQTADWRFSLVDDAEDRDRKVFQHFVWSYSGPGKPTAFTALGDIPRNPLVVAFQPPWILSAQDMLEFAQCRTFPRFSINDGRLAALEGKEQLWAKVWDTCVARKTRWFVLTSYNQWVFGAFSEGWTIGFVSLHVLQFDARDPTILEVLAFWVACAMRLPGWCGVPKIQEEVTAGPPRIPVRQGASGSSIT